MKATGRVKKSVAKMPKSMVEGPTSAVKAKGNWRALMKMKNMAAVMVAMKQGKSLSALPIKPSLVRICVKKMIVEASPTKITMNMTMPGSESRYWEKAAAMERPCMLGVQVSCPVMA